MSNEPAPEQKKPTEAQEGGLMKVTAEMAVQNAEFQLHQRKAKALAASSLLPDAYRNNMANCLIAMNIASKLGLDPYIVCLNLVIIHNRPSWTSTFIGALINQSGKFGPLRFVIKDLGKVKVQRAKGEPIEIDDYECYVVAKSKIDGEPIEGPPVSISMAVKDGWYERQGSKWQTLGPWMCRLRAMAMFGRLHCPEALLGLPTDTEVVDSIPASNENRRPMLFKQPAVEVAPDQGQAPAGELDLDLGDS